MEKRKIGCLVGGLTTITVVPMWLVLLYYILSQIDAAAWVWGLYWAYVPMSTLIGVASGVMQGMED